MPPRCARPILNFDLPRGFDGFFGWVMQMRRDLGIPHALADIGVTVENAVVIGSEAALDPSAGGNPIPVSAQQLERIFRAAVHGRLEDVESFR